MPCSAPGNRPSRAAIWSDFRFGSMRVEEPHEVSPDGPSFPSAGSASRFSAVGSAGTCRAPSARRRARGPPAASRRGRRQRAQPGPTAPPRRRSRPHRSGQRRGPRITPRRSPAAAGPRACRSPCRCCWRLRVRAWVEALRPKPGSGGHVALVGAMSARRRTVPRDQPHGRPLASEPNRPDERRVCGLVSSVTFFARASRAVCAWQRIGSLRLPVVLPLRVLTQVRRAAADRAQRHRVQRERQVPGRLVPLRLGHRGHVARTLPWWGPSSSYSTR
jgi:hypothetical protein